MANSPNWLIYLRNSEGRQLGYRILRRKESLRGGGGSKRKCSETREKGKRKARAQGSSQFRGGRNACQKWACGPIRNRTISEERRSTGVRN